MNTITSLLKVSIVCVCVFTRADAPLTGSKVLPWGSKDYRHQSPRVQTCNAPPVCLASWHSVVAVQGERGADKSRPPGGVERRTEGRTGRVRSVTVASDLGSLPFPSQLRPVRHSAAFKKPSRAPETAAGTRTLTATPCSQDPPADDSQRACQDKRNFSIYSPCLRLD